MVIRAPADGGLHPGVGSAGGDKCPEPGCIMERQSQQGSDVRRKRKRGTGGASEFLA